MSKANLPDGARLNAIAGDLRRRALAARMAGNRPAAVDLVRRSQLLHPGEPMLKNFEGLCLFEQDDRQGARSAFGQTLILDPGDAGAWRYTGILHFFEFRDIDARRAWRRSLALAPDSQATIRNLLQAERQGGRWQSAERAGRWSLVANPQDEAAAFDLGMLYLSLRRWSKGWPLYNRRIHMTGVKPRPDRFDLPFWDGRPDPALRLLLWTDQNVGDEMQFAQLMPELLERVGHVTLECDPRLVPLFRRSFPPIEAVPRSDPPQVPGQFDAQLPQGNLPGLLRNSATDFARTPKRWFKADATDAAALRDRYRRLSGGRPVVGIAWKSANKIFKGKNIPLEHWAPILQVPDVRFLSLQYGAVTEDLAAMRSLSGVEVMHDPEIDALRDLDRFAAQLEAVDLVVSISNSTIHQACGLGRPVWGMLHLRPDWRWGVEGETCPWFPTLRLYRQTVRFEWSGVAAAVAADLRTWALSQRVAAGGPA